MIAFIFVFMLNNFVIKSKQWEKPCVPLFVVGASNLLRSVRMLSDQFQIVNCKLK